MSFEPSQTGIDYRACRYPDCRIDFRGPTVDTTQPFVAVLGSSEAYGRYVHESFPQLVGEALNLPVANLGVQNGGVDVFVRDKALLAVAAKAEIVVIQVMGAHNLSNRYYTVHPRRNDRFLRHSKLMRATFRNVDFSDFVFTRHMLTALQDVGEEPFGKLTDELSIAWTARMTSLINALPGKIILTQVENTAASGLGPEPLFVNKAMIQAVEGMVDKVIQCDITEMINEAHLDDLVFPDEQIESARLAMPPIAHEDVAKRIVRAMMPMLEGTMLKGGSARRASVA